MLDWQPREFLCEHTPSKSRVHAVLSVHRDGRKSTQLKAVLTCSEPPLAERAAAVLTAAVHTGPSPELDARADLVLQDLPAAPAASFREALDLARTGRWPADLPMPDTGALSAAPDGPAESHTPGTARLAEFEGPVTRIARLTEFHIHNPERIVASATEIGWKPIDEDAVDGSPGQLALDAIMFMLNVEEFPGAEMISHQAVGEILDSQRGDEVVPWHAGPVIEEFDAGELIGEDGAGEVPTRDFAVLFPVSDCGHDEDDEDCEICSDWFLTPRTADVLHTALSVMSDEAYEDIEEHGDAPVLAGDKDDWLVFGRLPRLTWRQDAEWRTGIAHACENLVSDLEKGDWPRPRTNAEEIVLHLAIRDAPGYQEMAGEDDADHLALPSRRDDYDWSGCSELFFEDHDILMLYDNKLDGIEDPGNAWNQMSGMGDLNPASWFKSFGDYLPPRDPARRYRDGTQPSA